MANSKNTIQNIPLTGQLCLNTLKTDVAPFEGYNEKNTTVFGGELTPIRSKETELGSKDSTYTIFNSNGEPFTFNLSNREFKDGSGNVLGKFSVPVELEDCAPKDAYWYTFLGHDTGGITWVDTMIGQLYIDKTGWLWGRFNQSLSGSRVTNYNGISDLLNAKYQKLYKLRYSAENLYSVNASLIKDGSSGRQNTLIVAVIWKNGNSKEYQFFCFYNQPIDGTSFTLDSSKTYHQEGTLPGFTNTAFITIAYNKISFVPFSGKKTIDGTELAKNVSITIKNDTINVTTTDDDYFNLQGWETATLNRDGSGRFSSATPKTTEISPDYAYVVLDKSGFTVYSHGRYNYDTGYTGHDGNYFIPGIKSRVNGAPFTYIDSSLYTVSMQGRLVRQPGEIKLPFLHRDYDTYETYQLSFKDTNEKWYTYLQLRGEFDKDLFRKSFDKFAILDNRYISMEVQTSSVSSRKRYGFYDIERKTIIPTELGYVDTSIPSIYERKQGGNYTTTGIIYATGFNVNYPITNIPFVGLLSNPKVMTGFPLNRNAVETSLRLANTSSLGEIEQFYTIGDNVQSAEYHGNNPDFDGTVYPIDSNGNIIYPITWESKVLNGYSNNDFIKEGKVTYPLIYWNNNQKMYAYYLLSSMENVEGAFSLQGQQYTFDDNNIYNVQFTNGVIQGVNSVCYKKNMMFLGTLPKAAIFYSKFNKTFYQFTGDAILSKMFEASDINEIKFVGQNPSSLSLWICTDNGVYVMSDIDMFKVDYNVKDIYFEETKAILVTENETNWVENDISLYDIGDDAVETPIKLHTKFYGIGAEQKVTYDCWYIRLHNKDHKAGKLKLKVNTITNTSFETEEKTYDIEPSMYDSNDTIFIRYQPKYQSAVATQLELESDIAIYQISLGVNTTDAVAQQSKFNF